MTRVSRSALQTNRSDGSTHLSTYLEGVVIRPADDVLCQTEDGRVDGLGVPLKHVHGVNGRGSEVPQPESGVLGGGDYQLLGRVGTDVGELLVVP